VAAGWGARGTTLHRNGVAAGAGNGIDGISSDPGIASLKVGGPGSGGGPRFRGDVAEVRVYDRRLTDAERRQVEAELAAAWLRPRRPEGAPAGRPGRALRGAALAARPLLGVRGRAQEAAARRDPGPPDRPDARAGAAAETAAARDPAGRCGTGRRPAGHAP